MIHPMKATNPVLLAAKKAGSKYRLAKICGVTAQAVEDWQGRGQIPGKHVLTIEAELGLPRWKMRPDLYPPAEYRGRPVAA